MDAAYITLFAEEGEAAVLACDELGLVPSDLLHRPRQSFITPEDKIKKNKKKKKNKDNKNAPAVLVRYTLHERTRQNNLRRVLAVKNRIISEGNISQKWAQRRELFPNAFGVPKISKSAIHKAAAELDTESDKEEEDKIDERGMIKPMPEFTSNSISNNNNNNNINMSSSGEKENSQQQQQQQQQQREKELPLGNVSSGGENNKMSWTNSTPAILSSQEVSVERKSRRSVSSTAAPSNSSINVKPKSISKQTPISASAQTNRKLQQTRSSKSFNNSNNSYIEDYDEDYIICYDGEREVLMRRPKPPPEPPFLPPVPYSQRNVTNLEKEIEELEEYRRFLLRYAHDSSAMAQEYRNFILSQRQNDNNTGNKKANRSTGSADESKNQKDMSLSSELKSKNGSQRPNSSPIKNGMSPHERQLAAYVRLAKLEVKRNSSNYKKWNGFMEEMEKIKPTGTIAADLRSKINIGIWPTFEEYVQSVKEKAKRREKAILQERETQKKLGNYCEEKDRHTERYLEKLKSEHNDLFLQARLTQREIMKKNRERAERRYNMKLQRTQIQLAKREARAAEYHKNRSLSAKDKRFEHDSEEVFRKLLKERVHEMDLRKKWDVKSVKVQ